MDPGSLAIMMHALIPVLVCLIVFGLPVGIIFINKSHKLRMRELDIEAGQTPPNTDQRLLAIEERLANIESALTGASRPVLPTHERAALLEGPPDPTRLRSR
jgi:hypothetical protein